MFQVRVNIIVRNKPFVIMVAFEAHVWRIGSLIKYNAELSTTSGIIL